MPRHQLMDPRQRQRHDAGRERADQQRCGPQQAQVVATQQHSQGSQLCQQHPADAGTRPQMISQQPVEHRAGDRQLQASTQMLNLSQREADIAVRTQKPDNPELVVRRLARWHSGLFASRDYLQRFGEPAPGSRFAGHELVVYQPYLDSGKEVMLAGEPIARGRIAMTCTSGLMVRRALASGLGLGELPVPLGEREGLQQVWAHGKPYDIWLVTHQDVRRTARVRAVIEAIVQAFAD
ncbi:hypothetical protein HG549_25105 [Pseudomonas sp. SK]|nr:hypothetical protein HG549_25105 [Pseudomonas sp. SK]